MSCLTATSRAGAYHSCCILHILGLKNLTCLMIFIEVVFVAIAIAISSTAIFALASCIIITYAFASNCIRNLLLIYFLNLALSLKFIIIFI